jgi:hypothetical protein
MRPVNPPATRIHRPTDTGRPRGRPRSDRQQIAALAASLTDRDRWLTAMLYEHRVLTTHQVHHLAFGTLSAASRRLRALYRAGVLDRFRPYATLGSHPWHYVLDHTGAALLAAHLEVTVAQLGYRRDSALAIAQSSRLAHTVGTNGVLCALARHARRDARNHDTHHAARLEIWWSERRAATVWGDWVRPDAYARYREQDRIVDFFLEFDQGTEPLDRLVGKLAGYTRLARTTGIATPVLFWLPGPTREAHLLDRLRREPPSIPVATTAPTDRAHPHDPAGAVWATPTSRARHHLTDLGHSTASPPARPGSALSGSALSGSARPAAAAIDPHGVPAPDPQPPPARTYTPHVFRREHLTDRGLP